MGLLRFNFLGSAGKVPCGFEYKVVGCLSKHSAKMVPRGFGGA